MIRYAVKRRSQVAMTLVEAVIAIILFSLIAGFMFRTMRLQKLSWDTVEKLDVVQSFRIAERKIRKELELGTSVLWPPSESGGATVDYPYLVFTDPENVPQMIYIDTENRLVLLKVDSEPEVLCKDVKRILVRHIYNGFVTIRVVADSESRGLMGFTVTVLLLNGFLK